MSLRFHEFGDFISYSNFCRFQEEEETTTTTQAPRRHIPERVQQQQQQKTVVNHKPSYETISRKNTDTKQATTTLTSEDEDDDNVIAYPTESITETIPFPENILTTRITTTLSPVQVTENRLVQSESPDELLASTESEFEATTTLTNDFSDSSDKLSGRAKQSDEILSLIDISQTESPRPFSRPFVSRTRAPAIRNNDFVTTPSSSSSTVASSRRRPSRVSTTRVSTTRVDEEYDDDVTSRRFTGQTREGYRGTARYRTKQTKSGDYDHSANRYEPIDDNRVRAINFDRANRLNSIDKKTSTTQSSASSRRRPSVTRTETTPRTIKTTTASVEDDEATTEEQRVIEHQSRFALKPNERPERISFTLGTGSRIEFNTPKLDQRNDTSKSKIITGPLASSPLVSTRDFKKGHAEEIPLAKPTNISVESHSDKLDLSEIPLNKSDIASFVSTEALTTTPRVRLRPSKGGFAKSFSAGEYEDSTTTEAPEEEDDNFDTTTSRFRLRPSKVGTTRASIESDENSTQRTRFPPRSRVTVEQTRNEIDESSSSTARRTTPSRLTRPSRPSTESEATSSTQSRDSASRFIHRNRVSQSNSLDDSTIEESTTRKARVKITKINRAPEQKVIVADVNNLASDDEEVKKSSIVRPTSIARPVEEPSDDDENTENPLDDADETTPSTFDDLDELTTLDTPVESSSTKPRKAPSKKVDAFASRQTSTEATDDASSKAQKSTRRLIVTRRRPVERVEEEEQESPKKITTRRRLVSRTRLRPQVTDPDNANSELSENTETTNFDENNNTSGSTSGRRVVQGRTRVYKRPVVSTTAKPDDEDKPKYVHLKKLVKVTKKTKAPKSLGEQELSEDDFILKPEDLEQDVQNYNDEREDEEHEEKEVEDSVDVAVDEESFSEPSPRPGSRFATRPNAAKRVTIKRRPAIINIRQQTTVHPASTRTVKDSQATHRAKTVTIRRKFGSSAGTTSDESTPRKFTTLKTKKVYGGARRVSTSSSSTSAPNNNNITPYNTDTTDYDELDDTTDISSIDSNDDVNSQKSSSTRPRFSVRVKGTRSTTMTPPTTLHHVFAILEEANRNKSIDAENNASEVVKKIQKLVEINRLVEVYSKEEKFRVLKNKKLKTVKSSDLVVEKPPSWDKFGEISRQTIIKISKTANSTASSGNNVTTTHPDEVSTESSEGRSSHAPTVDESAVRVPVVQLRPESNETKPIVISLKSLDKVVLQKSSNDDDDVATTTETYENVTDLDEK